MADTRYAKNGNVHLAYQVRGAGALDIVLLPDWMTHIDVLGEMPEFGRFLDRLAGLGRLITTDIRGVGASDPVEHGETRREDWIGDIAAVMAAAGSARASLVGLGHGGQLAMLFAAAHPEATASLILVNTFARLARADDYRPGIPLALQQLLLRWLTEHFGDGSLIDSLGPSIANNPGAREWWAKNERLSSSPGRAIAKQKAVFALDVRDVLPQIKAPTLIMHSKDHVLYRADHARYLAEHIAGARYCELPGADHWPMADALYAEIEEFVTGVRPAPESDRVLATLLFTDLIGSTEKAAELGDRGWRNVLDTHDRIQRQCVAVHRGRIANWSGDGVLAVFDAPARAIRCAIAIRDALRPFGLELRAGVHTGEIEDAERMRGITVHIGARVSAAAGSGQILVSSTVRDLATGSGFRFEDQGMHVLKGIDEKWRLFALCA
jgi:class 3 adenylate cyclase